MLKLERLRAALERRPSRIGTGRTPARLVRAAADGSGAAAALRERHAIYMPDSGRLNVAGLNEAAIARFVEALARYPPF